MADELEPFRGGVEKKGDGDDVERPALHHPSAASAAGSSPSWSVLVLQNTNNANLHLLLFTVVLPAVAGAGRHDGGVVPGRLALRRPPPRRD